MRDILNGLSQELQEKDIATEVVTWEYETVKKLRIGCLLIFLFGTTVVPLTTRGEDPGKKEAKPEPKSTSLYKDLDLFAKVLGLIRESYVEEVDEKELVHGAVRGLLSTLDPHSLFMTPDIYKELKVDTEGKFGGVGLEITVKDNLLTVVTPIEDSPAAKSGIREGDRILKIDGVSTKELGLGEAIRKMRGTRGTRIHLVLLHEGSKEPFEVTLTRDIIRIKSVRHEMPEENIGYVRITSFQEDTAAELKRSLATLTRKTSGGLKGLILDLRNNPGGLLDQAVEVTDLFLKEGTIVTTVSRDKEVDKREATKKGTEADYPLIVMVNGGSASAAEIVAGALQDHKRGVILGTQTFGKGSVQTIFELGDGSALKLTVAKYYTPKGRSIQAEGITPDILVEAKKVAEATLTRERYVREKDLRGHLESEKEKKGIPETLSSRLIEEDYQKKVALDYLKSWNVFHH